MSAHGRIIHTTHGPRHVGGRHRPIETPDTHPHLFRSLKRYCPELPAAPSVVDYFSDAKTVLSDVLANDELGDCTAAGACHLTEAITAAAGAPVVLTREDAIRFYSLSTGYEPGRPDTDQGGNEITVLQKWQKEGLDGKGAHAIAGFAAVDPSDKALVRSALWLFGGLYFGCELPNSYVSPFPSGDGFLWKKGTPNPQNGHCFAGLGANEAGVQIDSWGLIGTIRYDAIAELCSQKYYGNLFVVLTHEAIERANELSPSGFDFAQLDQDMKALAA